MLCCCFLGLLVVLDVLLKHIIRPHKFAYAYSHIHMLVVPPPTFSLSFLSLSTSPDLFFPWCLTILATLPPTPPSLAPPCLIDSKPVLDPPCMACSLSHFVSINWARFDGTAKDRWDSEGGFLLGTKKKTTVFFYFLFALTILHLVVEWNGGSVEWWEVYTSELFFVCLFFFLVVTAKNKGSCFVWKKVCAVFGWGWLLVNGEGWSKKE